MEEKENNKSKSKIASAVFVGCMFLGAGIGMLYDKLTIGGAIGMGIGFLAMAVVWGYNGK
jgi:F0F1-type ATP synthase assembly protein I